ncbi:MAG: hypothetical protein FJ271_33295 [Planctomycetes bacterium]|nr:hypothetical protein [Planctomycetota bacterium]
MRQADIDRAVARATGETVETIRRLGFSIVPMPQLPPQNAYSGCRRRRSERWRQRNSRVLAKA